MQIHRSVLYVNSQSLKSLVRTVPLTIASIVVLGVGVLAGQNLLASPQIAHATTPPDSCFDYRVSESNTTTIDDYYHNEDNNAANPECPRTVSIPEILGSGSVTSIEDNSFSNKQIVAVTIPDSVVYIGDEAFADNQLTSVVLSGGVQYIGREAFANNQLTSVTNITGYLGEYAFANNQLTSVTIPDSVSYIGTGVFAHNQLTSATFSDSVGYIGNYAFSDNRLTNVTIFGGYIGREAFSKNQLTRVTIHAGWFVDDAFAYNRLTSVTLPDSVGSVSTGVFAAQNPWGGDITKSIPDVPSIYSSNPEEVQRAYNSMWYVRLYTASPSNPNNIKDSAISEGYSLGSDRNANGVTSDSIGGHIVNPARATITMLDQSDNVLMPPKDITGTKPNGLALSDYGVTSGGGFAVLNPSSPTPEEQTALDAGFAQYHRIDDTVSIAAPAVAGYIQPAATSVLLSSADNDVTFRYTQIVPEAVPAAQPTVNPPRIPTSTTPSTTYYPAVSEAAPVVSIVDFGTPSGSATNPTADSIPSGLEEILSKSIFRVDTSMGCSTINDAKLLTGNGVTLPLSGYTTIGGLDFRLGCKEDGGRAAVSLTLGEALTDLSKVKVYKQTALGATTDITAQVAISNDSTVHGERTVLRYNLTDGGVLDDDASVNGLISDPIYIAISRAESEPATLESTPDTPTASATGINIWVLIGGAGAAVLVAVIIIAKITQKK